MKSSASAFLMPVATVAMALGFVSAASAAPITCGSGERTATFDSAEDCEVGIGNPRAGDILSEYPGAAWSDAGELTGEGADGFLTVDLLSGDWESEPVQGTWSIASSFWATY